MHLAQSLSYWNSRIYLLEVLTSFKMWNIGVDRCGGGGGGGANVDFVKLCSPNISLKLKLSNLDINNNFWIQFVPFEHI